MDIKLNALTGDIAFTNGLDIVVTQEEEIQQRLLIRLRTFLGEWFINTSYGVPYFQQILGKGRKKATVDGIMQEQILADGSVTELVSFTSELNADRSYRAEFKVKISNSSALIPVQIEVNI